MSAFERIVSVGFKDGQPDIAISLRATELSEASADEIRRMMALAARRFDDMRKEFYPRIIQGGRASPPMRKP